MTHAGASARDPSRRTGQPVRAGSRYVGTLEAALWRPTNGQEKAEALEAARLYELQHKRKGRRNGPLGHVGLEVHRALWSCIDFATGRLEPSICWLMQHLGRSRDAVICALKRLRRCGFADWINRCEPTGRAPGARGPSVAQATNAYRLSIPEAARALLKPRRPRTEARGARPADYRLAVERERHALALASAAATRPYRADHFRDALAMPLSNALKRLGLLLNECESARPEQSRSRDSKKARHRPRE